MARTKRPIIINAYPPMLKVNGDLILSLFEVEDNDTVRSKLRTWGISQKDGYVRTDKILDYLERGVEEVIGSYTPKSEGSEKI